MPHLCLTLSDLASRWEAQRHPAAETVRQMRLVTHDLSALSHVSDPRELTRHQLRAFHDDLLSHHRRHTARKMFGLAHALLQFGVSETLLETNPAQGMTVKPSPASAQPRLPFTPSDLTRLFSHRVFTAHWIPPQRSAGGIAAYWLPLVLLCTGAPLSMAGALCTRNLLYSADSPSIPYWRFDIYRRGAPARQYRQPIHPILCRLGLLDYVGSLPPGSDLFPLLTPDRAGRRTARFSTYFGRFLRREVGIVEPHKMAASFRPTFACACRQAELPPDIAYALLGRADPYGNTERCGGETPLTTLQQAMARLTFAGFPQ